jgi:hypothetical protein
MNQYAQLKHPAFPLWMRESLDGAFAALPQVDLIGFEVWAESGYCDATYVNFHGSVYFRGEDASKNQPVTEDELDFVPWVRRMERNAKDIWHLFPIKLSVDDGSATINGDYKVQAKRNEFIYKFEDDSEEIFFVIDAKWNGNEWEIDERIEMPFYEGAYSSLLADPDEAIRSYSTEDLNLMDYPEVKSVEENNGIYIFHLKEGELMRCKIASEYLEDD